MGIDDGDRRRRSPRSSPARTAGSARWPPRTPSTRRTWWCSASAYAPRPTLAARGGAAAGRVTAGCSPTWRCGCAATRTSGRAATASRSSTWSPGRTRHIALGTHANKHGQVIGANVGGGYATFPGVVGTAVSKVCDLEIARTGLLETGRAPVGLRFVTVDHRVDQPRRLLPGRPPDDGQDARRAPHGPAARRADRRPGGRGQARGHRRGRPDRRHDGRADDRPGPRLRPAVLPGLGPGPGGGPQGHGRRTGRAAAGSGPAPPVRRALCVGPGHRAARQARVRARASARGLRVDVLDEPGQRVRVGGRAARRGRG